jgi:hypothetical protein
MEWFFEHITTLVVLGTLSASVIAFNFFERRFYTAPKGHLRVCQLNGNTLHIAGDFPNVDAVITYVRTTKCTDQIIVYNDAGQPI